MFIKGKAIGLSAAVLTIATSSLLFVIIISISIFFSLKDFEYNFINFMIDNGKTLAEGSLLFERIKNFLLIAKYVTLASTFIGSVAFIMVISINKDNTKFTGICFILISILRLASLGIASFVLFLISGIKLIGYNDKY